MVVASSHSMGVKVRRGQGPLCAFLCTLSNARLARERLYSIMALWATPTRRTALYGTAVEVEEEAKTVVAVAVGKEEELDEDGRVIEREAVPWKELIEEESEAGGEAKDTSEGRGGGRDAVRRTTTESVALGPRKFCNFSYRQLSNKS